MTIRLTNIFINHFWTIFSSDFYVLPDWLSPIFFILGRLGLEMTCMATMDTVLKKMPIAMRMMILRYSSDGVRRQILVGIPTASMPPWNPYLNGERYMIGQKMTLMSWTSSRLMKKPPSSMKGMMRTGTRAIAVSSLGIRAAYSSPQEAEQKQTALTIATSLKHSSAVPRPRLVAQQIMIAPTLGQISSKGKLMPVREKKYVNVLQLLLNLSLKKTGRQLAKVARVP